jgi:hypothetical protein
VARFATLESGALGTVSLIGDRFSGTRTFWANFAACKPDAVCVMLQGTECGVVWQAKRWKVIG